MDKLTIGSLFSGIGGLELGLEMTGGFETRWQCEIDPFCREVLAKHWPGVKRYGDIREVNWADVEPVDLICGGFPCQDVSYAGNRKGIEDGTRSGLWSYFAAAIHAIRPRFAIIENVPGLLTVGGGEDCIGFCLTWPRAGSMLNGKCYRQQSSARRTSARDSSLLPTPCAGDWMVFTFRPESVKRALANCLNGTKIVCQIKLPFLIILTGGSAAQSPRIYEWMMGFPPHWTALNHWETQLRRP